MEKKISDTISLNLQVKNLLIKFKDKNLCGNIFTGSITDWLSSYGDRIFWEMQKTVLICGNSNIFSYKENEDPFISKDNVVIVGARNMNEAIDVGILRILEKINGNPRDLERFLSEVNKKIGFTGELEEFLRKEISDIIVKNFPSRIPWNAEDNPFDLALQVKKLHIKFKDKNLHGEGFDWSDKDWKRGWVEFEDAFLQMQETVLRYDNANLFYYEEYKDPFIGNDNVVIVGARDRDEAINIGILRILDKIIEYSVDDAQRLELFISEVRKKIGPNDDLEQLLKKELSQIIYQGSPVGVPLDADDNPINIERDLKKILITRQEKYYTGDLCDIAPSPDGWTEETLYEVKKEFKVNEYISVKFGANEISEGATVIYINDIVFTGCDCCLLLNTPIKEIEDNYYISSKDEFWGICSSLQAWSDNNYDIHLLPNKLAFKLLKKLGDVGDSLAKKVFREEIIKIFEKENLNLLYYVINYTFFNDYGEIDQKVKEFFSIEDLLTFFTLILKKLLSNEDDLAYKIFKDLEYFLVGLLYTYFIYDWDTHRLLPNDTDSLRAFEKEISKLIEERNVIAILYLLVNYKNESLLQIEPLKEETIKSFLKNIENIKHFSIKVDIFTFLIIIIKGTNLLKSNYVSIEKILMDFLNMLDKVNLDIDNFEFNESYTLYKAVRRLLNEVIDTNLYRVKFSSILETLYRVPLISYGENDISLFSDFIEDLMDSVRRKENISEFLNFIKEHSNDSNSYDSMLRYCYTTLLFNERLTKDELSEILNFLGDDYGYVDRFIEEINSKTLYENFSIILNKFNKSSIYNKIFGFFSVIKRLKKTELVNANNIQQNFVTLFNEIMEYEKSDDSIDKDSNWIFRRICDFLIQCKGIGLINKNITIIQEVLNHMIKRHGTSHLSHEELKIIQNVIELNEKNKNLDQKKF